MNLQRRNFGTREIWRTVTRSSDANVLFSLEMFPVSESMRSDNVNFSVFYTQSHVVLLQSSVLRLFEALISSFTIMASKYDDWQSSKKTVLERNAFMFDNELMSDVSFVCGESSRVYYAHKYVLATSSAIFFAMFYGNLAQKEHLIRLPDTDEESFEEFLRFLYTDDCKITTENAIQVMYLAKKYFISSLTEKCCKILEESIKPDNVFAVLEQAVQFDEKELEAKCWEVVSWQTLECLNTGAFNNIGLHTLNAFIKKRLAVTEVQLFEAILKWADSECTRQGLNIKDDKTARRRVLGDSVYEIRFLTMSQENVMKYVSPTGILSVKSSAD